MWKANWLKFIEDLKGIPSKIDSNEISAPASKEKVADVEKKFGIELPPKFRDFLINSAGGVDIWWDLEDDALVQLDGERESISSGYFNFSLDEIIDRNLWFDADYEPDDYDLEVHPRNLLAFAGVENGDQFAVVHSGDDIDSIKYISHDLDDIHLYKVGEDINSFLSHYARIGFAGCEYWIWEQFTNQHTTPIDSKSPKSVEFLSALKGGIRSLEAIEQHNRAKNAMAMVHLYMNAEEAFEQEEYKITIKLLEPYEENLPKKYHDVLNISRERAGVGEALLNIGFINNRVKGRKIGWWLGKRYYGTNVIKVHEEYLTNLEKKIPVDDVDKPKCIYCGNPKIENQATCGNNECIEKLKKIKFETF